MERGRRKEESEKGTVGLGGEERRRREEKGEHSEGGEGRRVE